MARGESLQKFFDIATRQVIELEAERAHLRAQIAELQSQNARLRAAMEASEWVLDRFVQANSPLWCPWCGNTFSQGHAPDCQRQAALKEGSGD